MSTHNLCFEQEYEKYQNFSSENFPFLVVKVSIYLNRGVFVMNHWYYLPMSAHNLCFPGKIRNIYLSGYTFYHVS